MQTELLEKFLPGFRDLLIAKLVAQREQIEILLAELQQNRDHLENPDPDKYEVMDLHPKRTLRKLPAAVPATKLTWVPRTTDSKLKAKAGSYGVLPNVSRLDVMRWAEAHEGVFDVHAFRAANQGKYRALDSMPYAVGAGIAKSGLMKKLGPGRWELTAHGRKWLANG